MREISLEQGKYTIVVDFDNGVFKALRYGEEWQNLMGDKLTLALIHELEHTKERLSEAEDLLGDAHSLMGNVHCYDTEEAHAINAFLYGDSNE